MTTSAGPPGGGGEAYAVAPVALPPAKLRPGRVWYWMALAVFLVGVIWGVVAFVAIIGRVDSFQRVPFPGTGVISLARGGYVVYYEGPGASSGNVPVGNVEVTPLSGSAAIDRMASYSGSVTYQFGSHTGTAVLSLQIAGAGRFQVRATSSAAWPGSHLAFGSSIAGWIVAAAVPTAVLGLTGIVGAIVVAIIRHTRAKRARVPQLLELAARWLFPISVTPFPAQGCDVSLPGQPRVR